MVVLSSLFVSFLVTAVAASSHDGHGFAKHSRRQEQSPSLDGPTALTPFQDPFYTPTAGWENKPNGAIIKYRQIKTYGKGIDSTWQLLYRSESHNGTALTTVTTVWKPTGGFTDRFVISARPDNSVNRVCAPSTRFSNGTVDDQRFWDKKWLSSSVDHEGPDAAFGAGRLQGRLVLDGARAVINFAPLGFQARPMIVINGYSGGASSAGWAAQLAATYAPELNIVGATFGGVPADMRAIPPFVDGTLYAGLGFLGTFGIARGYSTVTARLQQILTPAGMQAWSIASNKCLSDAFYVYAGKKLLSTDFSSAGANLFNDPVLGPVLTDLTLGGKAAEVPKFPMYIYNGQIDQIIPVASVEALVNRYCAAGGNVLFRKTILADHFADVSNADVVPFVEGRFNKASFPAGCRRSTALFTWQTTNEAVAKQIVTNNGFFGPKSASQQSSVTSDDNGIAQAGSVQVKNQDNRILNLQGSDKLAAIRDKVKQLRGN